jgi:hypothetical protein
MTDQTRSYADRAVIYALLAVAAIVWFGLGGAVFLGILHDAGGG